MHTPKPSLKELGIDLVNLSKIDLILTITAPFLFFVLFFLLAALSLWPLAVLSAMALSFSTYGSTSHDLVHENLKINKTVNAILLSVTELICFRSGHAYKLTHLYHHKRYPHEDDIEGAAARMTFFRSLLEGVIFQFKLYRWSLIQCRRDKYRDLIVFEGLVVLLLVASCIIALKVTYIPLVYLCLMISGSWIIPLITSYAVHTPNGTGELQQTRLFRGWFYSLIAFDHLYHLEHHLYPMVPHKNWPKLATRLNNYFAKQGVKAMRFKI